MDSTRAVPLSIKSAILKAVNLADTRVVQTLNSSISSIHLGRGYFNFTPS